MEMAIVRKGTTGEPTNNKAHFGSKKLDDGKDGMLGAALAAAETLDNAALVAAAAEALALDDDSDDYVYDAVDLDTWMQSDITDAAADPHTAPDVFDALIARPGAHHMRLAQNAGCPSPILESLAGTWEFGAEAMGNPNLDPDFMRAAVSSTDESIHRHVAELIDNPAVPEDVIDALAHQDIGFATQERHLRVAASANVGRSTFEHLLARENDQVNQTIFANPNLDLELREQTIAKVLAGFNQQIEAAMLSQGPVTDEVRAEVRVQIDAQLSAFEERLRTDRDGVRHSSQ